MVPIAIAAYGLHKYEAILLSLYTRFDSSENIGLSGLTSHGKHSCKLRIEGCLMQSQIAEDLLANL